MTTRGRAAVGESVGAMVRARREELGWTVQKVADLAGCAKSFVSEVENGRRRAREETLRRLEKALRMRAGVLVEVGRRERAVAAGGEALRGELVELARLRQSEKRKVKSENQDDDATMRDRHSLRIGAPPPSEKTRLTPPPLETGEERGVRTYRVMDVRKELPREVPVINTVAGGYPRGFTDMEYPWRAAVEYVRAPGVEDVDAFAVRVVGEAMSPAYWEGDIVVVSPAKVVKDGDDCFVRLSSGESLFVRVYGEEVAEWRSDGVAKQGRRDEGVEMGRRGEGGGRKRGGKKEGIQASGHHGIEAKRVRLQPVNGAYAARVVDVREVEGMYAAVMWMRKLGR